MNGILAWTANPARLALLIIVISLTGLIASLFRSSTEFRTPLPSQEELHAQPLKNLVSDSPVDEYIVTSNGYRYKICDNPITRRIPREVLKVGLDERFRFSNKAFKMLSDSLNSNMQAQWQTCPYQPSSICKYSRGWSGLTHSHERWDMAGPVSIKCPEIRSFAKGDDEKRFCWSDELISGEQCVVFSIGSKNQWAFEEAVVESTKCIVHTFDCTVVGKVPEQIKSRVTFHKYCIGSHKDGENFKTLDELVKIAGVSQVDFLKMDIEGFEWNVIQDILNRAKETLTTTGANIFPNQMAVEFHYLTWFPAIPFHGRDLSPGEIYLYFENLFLEAGYAIADRHDNPLCPSCTELLLVQVKC